MVPASLAEWSKAVDLSSTIERCVGSNPTACNVAMFCNYDASFLGYAMMEGVVKFGGQQSMMFWR